MICTSCDLYEGCCAVPGDKCDLSAPGAMDLFRGTDGTVRLFNPESSSHNTRSLNNMSSQNMFLKNMRWFLRTANSEVPCDHIHIQMLSKEGVGGGNRSYGDAFNIPLNEIFPANKLTVEQVQACINNDTESLATDKAYTKGKIIVRTHWSDTGVMRISLARTGKMVKFFLSPELDESLKKHTAFAVRNGLDISK